MNAPGDQPVVDLGLGMLARRDHFTGELSRRLVERGCGADEVDAAIGLLRDRGLLNDADLATRKIVAWRTAGRSVAECRGRLEVLGVPESVIEAGFAAARTADELAPDSPDPDLAAATDLLRRWLGVEGTNPSASPTRRWAARLGRRGFPPDTIRAALRHYGLEDDSLVEEHPP